MEALNYLTDHGESGVIRLVVAHSQAIYCAGVGKVIALENDIRVVAQADSLEHFASRWNDILLTLSSSRASLWREAPISLSNFFASRPMSSSLCKA